VLDTNVGSKLFVALFFILLLHFIQGFVKGRARRLKHPVALGATEALKLLALNPYRLAWHGRSISLPCVKKSSGQRMEHA